MLSNVNNEMDQYTQFYNQKVYGDTTISIIDTVGLVTDAKDKKSTNMLTLTKASFIASFIVLFFTVAIFGALHKQNTAVVPYFIVLLIIYIISLLSSCFLHKKTNIDKKVLTPVFTLLNVLHTIATIIVAIYHSTSLVTILDGI